MKWFFERLREPSTAAGVGLVYMGFDAYARTGDWSAAVGAILAGLVAAGAGERQGGRQP